MNKIYFILLATILAFTVEGGVLRIIDDFTDSPYIARFSPPLSEINDDTAPYNWFSPYTNTFGYLPGTPYTNFKNVANVIGGQRDIIIGHISMTESASAIFCSVARASGTDPANFQIALPYGFIGGIYLQYDGVDNTVSATTGALLGKNIGGDNGAGSNGDGTVDFTFGGEARGIQVSFLADTTVVYELKVVKMDDDTTEVATGNFFELTVQATSSGFSTYYIPFDDAAWSDGNFDWTHVAGFQIKLFTEPPNEHSIDSSIALMQIGALQIGGNVQTDCLCDSLDAIALSGVRVNLFDTSVSTTTPRSFATTDANGDYLFDDFALPSGLLSSTTTYRICLDDTSLVGCIPTTGCYDFSITDATADLLDYDFIVAPPATLEIPDPVDVECSIDSTLPVNTGYAFATDCSGSRTQINTWSDGTPLTIGCISTITRVWAAGSVSGTQTINVDISTEPIVASQATDLTLQCDLSTDSLNELITAWIAAHGNAAIGCSDPASLTWTDNFSGTSIDSDNACSFTETVTFTVTNSCGASSSTSAVILILAPPVEAPTTRDTAQYITLPYVNTVNGDVTIDFEIPAAWEGIGVVDALWYRVSAATNDRTITASTCTTTVDSILAILVVANDGSLTPGAYNDDRLEPVGGCDILSSYVEYTVPAGSEFYLVVAAFFQGGDIDLSVSSVNGGAVPIFSCDELIVEAQSEIISSLTSQITSSTSLLQYFYNDLGDDVTQLNSDLNSGISDLNTVLLDQFSQLQSNLALTESDLSSTITTSEFNLSFQLEELAGSVYNVAYGVQAVANNVGSTDSAISALENLLNDVSGTLADVTASVDDLANTQLPEVNNAVNWLAANTETNFDVLESILNGRLDGTDGSVAQVSSQTNNVLANVAAVNTVVTRVKSYLETVNFERYLISSTSEVGSIPWEYRTPSSYAGKMDDLLHFVIETYNDKLAACFESSSAGCVWFRSNTAIPYSTLLSSYNTHVSTLKFKKAFSVLQSFYLTMFPTSLFV